MKWYPTKASGDSDSNTKKAATTRWQETDQENKPYSCENDLIVREPSDNACDAKRKNETKVKVSFFLSGEKHALKKDKYNLYFDNELFEHLKKKENYPDDILKDDKSRMPYMLVEDFNTTGLAGGINEKGSRSRIFWRTFGETSEGAGTKGQYGYGKTIFWKLSRICAIVGLSVCKEKKILFGRALTNSYTHNDAEYTNSLFFGSDNQNSRTEPITDEQELNDFIKDFNLKRSLKEKGFSVVIPFYNPDEINEYRILLEILDQYSLQVIDEKIEFNIRFYNDNGDEECWDVKKDNIKKFLDMINGMTDEERKEKIGTTNNESRDKKEWDKTKKTMKLMLEFQSEILEIKECDFNLSDSNIKKKIESGITTSDRLVPEKIFTEEERGKIKTKLNENQIISIKIPMRFKTKEKDSIGWFRLYLKKMKDYDSENLNLKAIHRFYRDGIWLKDLKSGSSGGIMACVILDKDKDGTENGELANMIGSLETTDHKTLTKNASEFGQQYDLGANGVIRYFKGSIQAVTSAINHRDEGETYEFGGGIFDIDDEIDDDLEIEATGDTNENSKKRSSRNQRGGRSSSGIKTFVSVTKESNSGSIKISHSGLKNPTNKTFEVVLNYHPTSWVKDDFSFTKTLTILKTHKAEIEDSEDNRITFKVASKDFFIKISGFDPNRTVKFKSKEI